MQPIDKRAIIAGLQDRIQKQGRGSLPNTVRSTGAEALDDLLPAQGVRLGSLVEWVAEGHASGAATLSLVTGRHVCRDGRVVLIDGRRQLFPLSLQLLGFDLSRIVMIRPSSETEALWACEEALRCEGIGLVWASIERLSSLRFRRLQLAAETGAGVGFLLRSAASISQQPSWADARLLVRPRPSHNGAPCFRVQMAHGHGRPRRSRLDLMLDNLQGTLHEFSTTNSANPLRVDS